MELGMRIKAARLEAGLSQRQLCGDVITRNMLSLIESGKARPSMDTLRHFANVLGRPLAFFLEEEMSVSPNQKVMQQAENAYAIGDFSACLEALENYRSPDPIFDQLRYLLELLACEALAEQAIGDDKKAYALNLLDRADALAGSTIYAPENRRNAILRYRADPTGAVKPIPISDELVLNAEAAMAAENFPRAVQLLDACDKKTGRWWLLRGTAAVKLSDHRGAIPYLQKAAQDFPRQALPLLELCYLQLGDYKSAYECAKKQL